jgi:subtilisin family serine protease
MRSSHFALAALLASAAVAAGAQQLERKGYVIELADAPAAAYEGTVSGLAATRPAPGAKLNVNASHVQAYLSYLDSKAASVTSIIPSAPVYYRYGVAFNGFAAKLTDAEVQKLLAHSGVRAVTADEARPLDTTYTPAFLGISTPGGIWSQTDASGRLIKGEDIIIAHVDGGVWPENPSFSDKIDPVTGQPVSSHLPGTVVYGAPPAKWTGICEAGLGFTTSMCNNKLIGARYFNTGWKANRTPAQLWSFEYLDSPRDADGHGSHTLSTSGGNENVATLVGGVNAVTGMSGIAPRARVASYKVCYNGNLGPGVSPSGCFNSDSVAAINQAVADGADVINFSISGSQTSFRDAVETAFRNAAAAGVYVSASAGNANTTGAPTVAHNSPWVMTVGNSTHDRYTEAIVTLGNGVAFQGASFQTSGLASAPLVWSRNAGFGAAAAQGSNQALCFGAADSVAPLLDPAKVAGKIVVCDRGGNVLVNKVANARAAGAVGVIIQNTPVSANTTPLISAVLPTVHLPVAAFTAVTTEASLLGGTARFSPSFQVAGVVAPVMSGSSSRGPNQADLNVLKPDITAPGTDIIAAFANRGLTQAERDAVAAGTLIPNPWAESISGTSMSSPHSAGIAALLKQANPTWSPYAIKSAIMTSAAQTVKLSSGAVDANRWGFGAGHVNPNAALATQTVFDQTSADHLAYYNGTLSGTALNLASMTAANVIGVQTFNRTLTNKGNSTRTYNAAGTVPGFTVAVSPASITLAAGASAAVAVTVTRTTGAIGTWAFGEVVFTAGDGSQSLRSPITVRPQSFVGFNNLTDTRTVGTKVITVATGYSGTFNIAASGMVAATRLQGTVATNQRVCFPFSVPAGAKQLRAQMFNSETGGGATSDIDLIVLKGTTTVGSGLGATSDELVIASNPAAGTDYQACADGFAPAGGSAAFTINLWVVPAVTAPATLRAFGPASVMTGGTASVGVSWNVAAGNRHLGIVEYRETAGSVVLGSTTVFIDTSAASTAAQAPLLRDKPLN